MVFREVVPYEDPYGEAEIVLSLQENGGIYYSWTTCTPRLLGDPGPGYVAAWGHLFKTKIGSSSLPTDGESEASSTPGTIVGIAIAALAVTVAIGFTVGRYRYQETTRKSSARSQLLPSSPVQ